MQAVPKFKNSAPGPNHALYGGILSCLRWDLPRSIRVPNLKFLASPVPKIRQVPLNGWVREGVYPNSRVDLCCFYPTPTKFGVDIVEWSMLNANVLDFRCIFALSNYGANYLRLGAQSDANFVFFSGPVRFRGHFEKIGIAKVLLGTKPRRVGKFCGCRFCDLWESVARKKTLRIHNA